MSPGAQTASPPGAEFQGQAGASLGAEDITDDDTQLASLIRGGREVLHGRVLQCHLLVSSVCAEEERMQEVPFPPSWARNLRTVQISMRSKRRVHVEAYLS